MTKSFFGHVFACGLALGTTAAVAQDVRETDFDYDALISELPIESEVYAPLTTFTNRSGGVTTFYGQLNLTSQSFDDGEETTSNIVDNGNWNSRLGFTIDQPIPSTSSPIGKPAIRVPP